MFAYGKLRYRVKWTGHDKPDPKWYPAKNFENATEVVQAYHNKYPDRPHGLATRQAVLNVRKEKREQA